MLSLLFSVAMLFTLTSKIVSDKTDHGAPKHFTQDISFVYPSKQAKHSPRNHEYIVIEDDIMADPLERKNIDSMSTRFDQDSRANYVDRTPSNAGPQIAEEDHLIYQEQYIPVLRDDIEKSTPSHRSRSRRAVSAVADRLWPDGKIPFEIGPNISETTTENILLAMSHWERHTCIRFINHTKEKDYVKFNPGDCGCCSFVGRRGDGEQEVTLSPHCAAYGVVIHELGHAIGFWHEHSRPDRDKYIQIIEKNVVPEKAENFRKMSSAEINSLGQPYDYYSIMHYRKKTFSHNGRNTMQPYKKGVQIGQRVALSPGDIVQTRLLYNCPKPACYEEFFKMEGNFTSPNYPIKYFKEHSCVWVIHVLPGEKLTIEFVDFEVEQSPNCTFDFVEMREGIDETGTLIGRLCGEGAPGIVQSGHSIWMKFQSDKSMSYRGFHAQFWKKFLGDLDYSESSGLEFGSGEDGSGELQDIWKPSPTVYTARCNLLYSEVQGTVITPVFPIFYQGDPVACSWTINGGVNSSSILLQVTRPKLSMETTPDCAGDVYQQVVKPVRHSKHVTRRSHKAMQDKDIGRKHEQDVFYEVERYTRVRYDCSKEREVTIESKSVMIQWSSESNAGFQIQYTIDYNECLLGHVKCAHYCKNTVNSYQCSCRRGFTLHKNGWKCIPKVIEFSDRCGSNMTSGRGKIRATTEPLTDCHWWITQPEKHRIILTFTKLHVPSLSTQDNETCPENYIEVRSGKGWNEKARFCGDEPPGPITVASHHLAIILHTNLKTALTMPYFSAKYFAYETNGKGKCFHRAKANGNITSPSFPGQYPPNTMCVWRVSARHGEIILMTFDLLDIESTKLCHADYLEVRDGKSRDSPFLGRYCGNNKPTSSIISSGRHLWIMFLSDQTGSGRGFAAHFTTNRPTWSAINKVRQQKEPP